MTHLRVASAVAAVLGAVASSLVAPALAQASLVVRANAAAAGHSKGGPTPQPKPNPQPKPLGVPGKWQLILDSDFTGTKLDRSLWRPGWFGNGITGPINTNELACYSPANVTLPGNNSVEMNLTATASRCKGQIRPYTGAILSTNPDDGRSSGGFAFTYGLVQARLFVPGSWGHISNWPAVMTLGQRWPNDGEDDLLEGVDGTICTRFHSLQNILMGAGGCLPQLHGGWYTIAADWEPGSVTWYYNGTRVGYTTKMTGQAMYLAIAYSASRKAPQVARQAALRVTYVRVWQHPGAIAAGVDQSRF